MSESERQAHLFVREKCGPVYLKMMQSDTNEKS